LSKLTCRHLRRYLLPLLPTSRIEIYTTDRYTSVTGHVELAVYATRPLPIGAVIQELQGSVVPLPDAWREEMEIGEDFALDTAAEENGSGNESGGNEEDGDEYEDDRDRRDSTAAEEGGGTSRKGRRKREPKGARRSDRTKRRDFSIVWSGLKRCFQLFLGPARFLNVSSGVTCAMWD
jgi:histone-lysine N-methyltransferase SUV420H